MSSIHPTAIIDTTARIGDGAKIGPFCVVGPDVELGANVELISHVCVVGRTKIGTNTKVFPFTSLGHAPQDLKYGGEASELVIGSHNVIREHVTMNPGTEGGGMLTHVGDHCLFMAGSHVAHDCHVGDFVILVNNATLAGHVEIGDYARLQSLNLIGLKRRKFTRDEIHELRKAYRLMFSEEGTLSERLDDVAEDFVNNEPVMEIVNFIRHDSSRAICQPGSDNAA